MSAWKQLQLTELLAQQKAWQCVGACVVRMCYSHILIFVCYWCFVWVGLGINHYLLWIKIWRGEKTTAWYLVLKLELPSSEEHAMRAIAKAIVLRWDGGKWCTKHVCQPPQKPETALKIDSVHYTICHEKTHTACCTQIPSMLFLMFTSKMSTPSPLSLVRCLSTPKISLTRAVY